MVDRTDRGDRSRMRSKTEGNYEAIQHSVEQDIDNEQNSDTRTEPGLEELEDLETELGMEEVDVDQAVIDAVAVDDTDNNLDADDDGIVDETDNEELIDNL